VAVVARRRKEETAGQMASRRVACTE